MTNRNVEFYENVFIRGMHFRGTHAKEYVELLEDGQELYLKREPDNQYDSSAIQVWTQPLTAIDSLSGEPMGFHFGYIAAESAQWAAASMDGGMEFTCTVTGIDRSGKTPYPVVNLEEIV